MTDAPPKIGTADLPGVTPRLPLVSVGVPTFNGAGTLERALTSVLSQDYPELEVVISDNASTDETEAVCRQFASRDPRVRYLRKPTNCGPTENFMEVLRQARGKYFMWLGDDDWLADPSYVSKCTSFLVANPDYSLACGVARYFRKGVFLMEGLRIELSQESPADRLMGYYATIEDNGTFYGVMRREQMLRIGMKPVIANDWFFIAAVAFLGKVMTLAGTSVHREDNTPERTYEGIAAENRQAAIRGRYPFLFIGLSILYEVGWASPVYGWLPRTKRLALGLRCQAIVLRRHVWPGARARLRAIARRLSPAWMWAALRSALGRPGKGPHADHGSRPHEPGPT